MSDAEVRADTRSPPLAGRRVLDLSRVLAGPWSTMILADLGAEVIKVENPKGGDDTRHWGPPYAGGEAAYYLCANRNKKSIAVDLSRPEGQEIVRRLAALSDVLVENYKLGGLDRYGLDYASIAAVNRRIVYCSISGYGRASPIAERPGYDYVIQAEGGLMAITGEVDDSVGIQDAMRLQVVIVILTIPLAFLLPNEAKLRELDARRRQSA